MATIDVPLVEESQSRYLTYALSVVSSRALPDVRDGLKPVQRRILYAMLENLRLTPEKAYRKSAAVVGEVLARYHPHGDAACYEAMVRMAQDFNFRYPLVDGQGNFGSLDGDSAAAYRYTEARLTLLALEVIGDIGQNTVAERDNFDQTVKEPVVLPCRVPNLLVNGAAGIAVGMATSIPPHNLVDVVKALTMLLADPATTDRKLVQAIKGPDFPTGCQVLNTPEELLHIYTTGRGGIRMRSDYIVENAGKGKDHLVITSIPYTVDKSILVQKIADLIIQRKFTQIVDIRDESTDVVRIVMELSPGAQADKIMAYLYKHSPLQQNFNVNLTALIPTANPMVGRPVQLTLREMLQHFLDFRVQVVKLRLEYERAKLEERVHLLEGLVLVNDVMDEVIAIVRKSEGRSDAAKKLQKRFSLSEAQAFFIVDLRVYQLSRTSVSEIQAELDEKARRIALINAIVESEERLKGEVREELERIAKDFGDKRRSQIVHEFEEVVVSHEEYIEHEDVHVIVTQDAWLKRIRSNNDPSNTRLREGDSLFFSAKASTKDLLALVSSVGNVFVTKIHEISSTSGFGEPVQKLFKFGDEEKIIACLVMERSQVEEVEGKTLPSDLALVSERGFGFRTSRSALTETKKGGRRLMRLSAGDSLLSAWLLSSPQVLFVSDQGYGLVLQKSEVPELNSPAKGVILQKLPTDERVVIACSVEKSGTLQLQTTNGIRPVAIKPLTMGSRAQRGTKVIARASGVVGLAPTKG